MRRVSRDPAELRKALKKGKGKLDAARPVTEVVCHGGLRQAEGGGGESCVR